jgi:valyl-tRNA synthetase
MRTPVLRAVLALPAGAVDDVATVLDDVRAAGRVTGELELVEAEPVDGADAATVTEVREVELGEAEARARA